MEFAENYPRGVQTVDVLNGEDSELEFTMSEPKVLGPKGTPAWCEEDKAWLDFVWST